MEPVLYKHEITIVATVLTKDDDLTHVDIIDFLHDHPGSFDFRINDTSQVSFLAMIEEYKKEYANCTHVGHILDKLYNEYTSYLADADYVNTL